MSLSELNRGDPFMQIRQAVDFHISSLQDELAELVRLELYWRKALANNFADFRQREAVVPRNELAPPSLLLLVPSGAVTSAQPLTELVEKEDPFVNDLQSLVVDLYVVLADPFLFSIFWELAQKRYNLENALFYMEIVTFEQYAQCGKYKDGELELRAKQIYTKFLDPNSKYEINLSSNERDEVDRSIRKHGFAATSFESARTAIYKLLQQNVVPLVLPAVKERLELEHDTLFQVSLSLPQLIERMRHPIEGVSVATRKWRLRTYHDCFIDYELVDWVLMNTNLNDRRRAIAIGNELVNRRVIRHVHDEHTINDGYYFFEFCSENAADTPRPRSSRLDQWALRNRPTCERTVANRVLPLIEFLIEHTGFLPYLFKAVADGDGVDGQSDRSALTAVLVDAFVAAGRLPALLRLAVDDAFAALHSNVVSRMSLQGAFLRADGTMAMRLLRACAYRYGRTYAATAVGRHVERLVRRTVATGVSFEVFPGNFRERPTRDAINAAFSELLDTTDRMIDALIDSLKTAPPPPEISWICATIADKAAEYIPAGDSANTLAGTFLIGKFLAEAVADPIGWGIFPATAAVPPLARRNLILVATALHMLSLNLQKCVRRDSILPLLEGFPPTRYVPLHNKVCAFVDGVITLGRRNAAAYVSTMSTPRGSALRTALRNALSGPDLCAVFYIAKNGREVVRSLLHGRMPAPSRKGKPPSDVAVASQLATFERLLDELGPPLCRGDTSGLAAWGKERPLKGTLYVTLRDANCRLAALFCAAAAVPFQPVVLCPELEEQYSLNFRSVNPNGTLPWWQPPPHTDSENSTNQQTATAVAIETGTVEGLIRHLATRYYVPNHWLGAITASSDDVDVDIGRAEVIARHMAWCRERLYRPLYFLFWRKYGDTYTREFSLKHPPLFAEALNSDAALNSKPLNTVVSELFSELEKLDALLMPYLLGDQPSVADLYVATSLCEVGFLVIDLQQAGLHNIHRMLKKLSSEFSEVFDAVTRDHIGLCVLLRANQQGELVAMEAVRLRVAFHGMRANELFTRVHSLCTQPAWMNPSTFVSPPADIDVLATIGNERLVTRLAFAKGMSAIVDVRFVSESPSSSTIEFSVHSPPMAEKRTRSECEAAWVRRWRTVGGVPLAAVPSVKFYVPGKPRDVVFSELFDETKLSSEKHRAVIEPELGGIFKIAAISGKLRSKDWVIEGMIVDLVANRRIVLKWRPSFHSNTAGTSEPLGSANSAKDASDGDSDSDWPESHFAHWTIEFSDFEGGTQLSVHHTGVPFDRQPFAERTVHRILRRLGAIPTATAEQIVYFPCSAMALYDWLINSNSLSALTKSRCEVSDGVMQRYSLINGAAHGVTIAAVPGVKIIRTFQFAGWPSGVVSMATTEFSDCDAWLSVGSAIARQPTVAPGAIEAAVSVPVTNAAAANEGGRQRWSRLKLLHSNVPASRGSTNVAVTALSTATTSAVGPVAAATRYGNQVIDEWWTKNFWDRLGGVRVRAYMFSLVVGFSIDIVFPKLVSSAFLSEVMKSPSEVGGSEPGSNVSLANGMLVGEIVQMQQTRIEMLWRVHDFPPGFAATATITLVPLTATVDGGCLIEIRLMDVPAAHRKNGKRPWKKLLTGLEKTNFLSHTGGGGEGRSVSTADVAVGSIAPAFNSKWTYGFKSGRKSLYLGRV